MFSAFEMQKDKRNYGNRREVFSGPMVIYPPEKIDPYRQIKWNEQGLLEYEMIPGCKAPVVPEDEEEEEAEE